MQAKCSWYNLKTLRDVTERFRIQIIWICEFLGQA